ncbi:hypothetical protein EBZ37_11840 [bacterium]|nr:hypothetical protein [bacterium]
MNRVTLALITLMSVCSTVLVGCASMGGSKNSQAEAQKWVGLAEASLGDNDPSGALQELLKAEEISSDLPSLHHARALAYLAKSDLSLARDSARRAYELAPKDGPIATTYGKILIDLNRYAEAEAVLLPAARDPLYRESYRPRTNLGILNLRRGDYSAARFHLDRAIQDSPEQACVAYHFRGQLGVKQGRLKDAIRDLERSTQRLCAGYGEAEVSLGSALISDRQYDRARKKFLEINDRFPGTAWADAAMERLRGLP